MAIGFYSVITKAPINDQGFLESWLSHLGSNQGPAD